MKFSVGEQVVEGKTLHTRSSYNILKVVAILDETILATHYAYAFNGEVNPSSQWEEKPGSRSYRQSILRYQEDELITTEEAVKEIHRLDAAKSKLDTEFEEVRDQIEEKLRQAAELVKGVNALTKPFDRELADLKSECMPLYRALDEGGWSHSHMKC